MPNPLERFQTCQAATLQTAYDHANQAYGDAEHAFEGFVSGMPREQPLTVEQWQEFNRVSAALDLTADARNRAFRRLKLCNARHSQPLHPALVPPKGQ